MMYRKFALFFTILCVVAINLFLVAQDVLFEDEYICTIPNSWNHFLDSLDSHDVTVHLASLEGRANLMNMDMLMLIALHGTFNAELLYPELIEFVRNGGNVLIWGAGVASGTICNPMLTDTRWKTTMEIQDA